MSRIASLIALLTLFALTGCTQYVSFNIKTPGITNGTFIIKNDAGQMVYSGSIKNGQLKLDKQMLEQTGYYSLVITDDAVKATPVDFEIYLDPGNYNIITHQGNNTIYPQITSSSPIQRELSLYYTALASKLNTTTAEPVKSKDEQETAEKLTLQAFIKKYPQNVTGAHLMIQQNYESDPATYYAMFKGLSEQTRNSDEGKTMNEKLGHLVKLLPGAAAPAIAGTTPDGKPFSTAGLNKKIYLVEFWKAGNEVSRLNHSVADVTNMLSGIPGKKDFGMISISLDEKRDWWTSAIKDDHMNWPQYSDLKGNDSPNAANWGIIRIPTYYLVDGSWHIVARNVPRMEVPVDINEYLKKH